MNKKDILYKLIKTIKNRGLLTDFIKDIFCYQELNDYNYIFRIIKEDDKIIIDIYDNVSDNRFNRYIFNYEDADYTVKRIEENNVYVTNINVLRIKDSDNKLYKLVYMTLLSDVDILDYAANFLDQKYVNILAEILKK